MTGRYLELVVKFGGSEKRVDNLENCSYLK